MFYLKSRKVQIPVIACLLLSSAFVIAFRKLNLEKEDIKAAPSPSVTADAAPVRTPLPSPTPSPAPTPSFEELHLRRVTGNNVCLRDKADPESSNLDFLYYGNTVEFIGDDGEWTEVSFGDKRGFVHSEYLCRLSEYPETDGKAICEFALSMVGTKYKWAGNTPETGFDCSGFLQYVFEHFDIPLNRIASDQALNGTPVEQDEMIPGDIVCFRYRGKITHCAIYVGDGQVVHAANEKHGVNTADISVFTGAELVVRRMT